MRTFKTIERKAHLLGLPMQDLFILLLGFSLAVVLGIVLNFFLAVTKYYFFSVLALTGCAFFLLKRFNARGQSGFLFSWLSYRFLQPKQMHTKTGRLPQRKLRV